MSYYSNTNCIIYGGLLQQHDAELLQSGSPQT